MGKAAISYFMKGKESAGCISHCTYRIVSIPGALLPGERSGDDGDFGVGIGLIRKNNLHAKLPADPLVATAGCRAAGFLPTYLSTYSPKDLDCQDVFDDWLQSKLIMQKGALGVLMKNHKWAALMT